MRLFHRFGLFTAHRKCLVMRAGEPLPRAQFGEHRLHVLEGAAHPFQFGVFELLPDECRAHLVVAEDGAVVALGGFVQFDLVVLDGGGLELLGKNTDQISPPKQKTTKHQSCLIIFTHAKATKSLVNKQLKPDLMYLNSTLPRPITLSSAISAAAIQLQSNHSILGQLSGKLCTVKYFNSTFKI